MQEFLIQNNKLIYVKISKSKNHKNIVLKNNMDGFDDKKLLFKETLNYIKHQKIQPSKIKVQKHNKALTLELIYNLQETIKIIIVNLGSSDEINNKIVLQAINKMTTNIDETLLGLANLHNDIMILTQQINKIEVEECEIMI